MILLAPLALLAACDDGGMVDQTVRAGLRQSAVQACTAWVPQSDLASAAGLDGGQLCSCAVDRMLTLENVTDLTQLRPDSREGRAAIARCVAEIQSRSRQAQAN